MAINQFDIVLKLLKNFSEGVKPSCKDYDIEDGEFKDIIYAMKEGQLIEGDIIRKGAGNKILMVLLDNVKITLKGMQYLKENLNN